MLTLNEQVNYGPEVGLEFVAASIATARTSYQDVNSSISSAAAAAASAAAAEQWLDTMESEKLGSSVLCLKHLAPGGELYRDDGSLFGAIQDQRVFPRNHP
eukprot:SAG11_NODE_4088_length_2071_cov_1.191176_1_plen_101_part_00